MKLYIDNIKNTITSDFKNPTFRVTFIFILVTFIIILIPGIGLIDPINYLFGVPCPGCGLTRATYALLEFDFYKSWSYNPSLIFLVIALGLVPLRKLPIFKNKLTNNKIFAAYIAITLIIFIIRIVFFWGEGVMNFEDTSLIFGVIIV